MNLLFLTVIMIPLLLVPLVSAATSSTAIPNIKAEMNTAVSGEQLVSSSTYLNKTDGDYHIKGIIKNTLAESRDFEIITASYSDIKTDASLSINSSDIGPIGIGIPHVSPGGTVPFDIDTGYKANETNQLANIKVMLTV
jgi:hypothetical protein